MANRIPVKAIYSGSDVTSLGEYTSSDKIDGAYISDDSVDEANLKISNSPTNGYVLTAQSGASGGMSWALDAATDSTKLPLAGGTMTGNVTHASNSYLDMANNILYLNDSGRAKFGTSEDMQIYHDGSNSIIEESGTGALLIKTNGTGVNIQKGDSENIAEFLVDGAVKLYHNNVKKFETTTNGATVTGSLISGVYLSSVSSGQALSFGDNRQIHLGTGDDLKIYHDGSNSYIDDTGTGDLILRSNGANIKLMHGSENMITAQEDGQVKLYYDGSTKFKTSANGVTVTGGAVGTMTTDNDGSFAMSASNNFKCTPSGNFTLTFTSIVAQSGNILLINSGGHTVSAHANTKVDAKFLATISTAGTYLLAYFSDGTNVYMTNSAVYT